MFPLEEKSAEFKISWSDTLGTTDSFAGEGAVFNVGFITVRSVLADKVEGKLVLRGAEGPLGTC